MSKKPKEEQPVVRPVPVALSDNDVLMLLQAAEVSAGAKAASIHTKQIFSALNELYERRRRYDNYLVTPIDGGTQQTAPIPGTITTVLTHAVGNVAWTAVLNDGPKCQQCGQLYISIPRMGIFHICPEKANT
jgi:hypothetical protein